MPEKDKSTTHLEDIMMALDFTGVDLEANRGGGFSDRQKRKMMRANSIGLALMGAFTIGITALMSHFFWLVVDNGHLDSMLSDGWGLVFLAILICFPSAFIIFMIYYSHKLWRTRQNPIVGELTGAIQLKYNYERKHHSTTYYLWINHKQFYLNKATYHTLRDGGTYRVYFTMPLNEIVAIEPL